MSENCNDDSISQDEICDSQPISLPSSNNSDVAENELSKTEKPIKYAGQMGSFRSIEEIDPKYRHIFSYPYFNLVQSRVIEDALYSDKSMVVCAPTGSGKTVIFEMAIVQLLMELENKSYTEDFKIIYMAPVKALCTERLTEWYPKFTKLGHLCIEVTGDTDVEFPQLKPYRIIITTPEKWDMLTRRWKDHRSLVEVIKLFLIDEVHILNDEIRGPVLEAVVSRMKTIESSVQCEHRIEQLLEQYRDTPHTSKTNDNKRLLFNPIRIRFVAISATVSNPQDVADWLGTSDKPAVYHKFGDECRPVKLRRIVEGYPCSAGTSIFKFDIILNYKLWNIIQKYHNGKPTLIFCNTRKSVALTAETLSREITVSFTTEQKNKLAAIASTIKNKKIQSLILCGVGCHHAGLLYEERMNIESAFRSRDLPILITTTTLAMGVNLPAHLVIIKNTQQYVNGAYQEYNISTILQMVGRAGRPQYDTEATAVIITRSQDKHRYQSLVDGSEPLQSYLHKRLAENLNSEAALGTVCDVAQCVQWLNSTFLSVRAARDPKRYLGLPHAAPPNLISKKIEELCIKAMNGLASAGLITMDEACCISSTEAGRLMSIYYLDLETMKLIMKLEGSESLERLLWLICESHELSDMHLRVDERRCLNSLNRNSAAATVRFPMKGKINTRQMKLSCVIQAVLGCLSIPDPSLNQESIKIMRIAERVCKCLVYYVTRPSFIAQNPKFYSTILKSIILAKCIYARLWENSPYVSRQLKGIGPIFSNSLASAGKVNFMLLEESHPRDLERIMNKGPPIGNIIRRQVSLLPKYQLTATSINEKVVQVKLSLLNHAYLLENIDHLTAGVSHMSYIIVGDTENYLLHLNSFKESDLINVYDGSITFEVTRRHDIEHEVLAHCISSTLVGIDEHCKYLFKDLNPIPKTNASANDSLLTKTSHNIHDNVFQERKRKIKDTDIMQRKEKKKRDIGVIEKFKNLKDSSGNTSKKIKLDLHKTIETSNTIPGEPVQQSSNTNMKDKNIESLDDSFENVFAEDFNEEDVNEDERVSDILDVIESEIKNNENTVAFETKKNFDTKINFNKYKFEPKNVKRKQVNLKNNYNFIDKLESHSSTNSDNERSGTEFHQATGFTNAIKCQIEEYIQRARDYSDTTIDIAHLIEPKIDNKQKFHQNKEEHISQYVFNSNETDNGKAIIIRTDVQSGNAKHGIYIKPLCEVDTANNISISEFSNTCAIKQKKTNLNVSNLTKESHKEKYPNPANFSLSNNMDEPLKMKDERALVIYPSVSQSTATNRSSYVVKNKTDELIIHKGNFENIRSVSTNNESAQVIPSNSNYKVTYTNDASDINRNLNDIQQYKASQTKCFNLTTENSNKQKVQIIGKIKVDLDVTKIVYNTETHNINETTEGGTTKSTFHSKNILSIEKNYNRPTNSSTITTLCDKINTEPKENSNELPTKIKSHVNNLKIRSEQQTNEPIANNASIKDILMKYKNEAKRLDTENTDSQDFNKQLHSQTERVYIPPPKINRRKLRICDIDKIQVNLPPSLIAKSHCSSEQFIDYSKKQFNHNKDLEQIKTIQIKPSRDNIYNNIKCNDSSNFNCLPNLKRQHFNKAPFNEHVSRTNLEIQNRIQNELHRDNVDLDIGHLSSDLPSPDLAIDLKDDDVEFDANTILNPRALLHTMHVSSEDLIPPPPQFSDAGAYSPVRVSPECNQSLIINDEYLTEYNVQSENKYDSNTSLFGVSDGSEFTPSEVFETYSPSHVMTCPTPYSTPGHSFTVLRRNFAENNNTSTSNFSNSRRAKLALFKFKRDGLFRK